MAIPVIYQLITMVILMIIGVVLHKKNFLSLTNAKGLSIVLTRVAVPCNMVVLLQREYSPEIFKGFLVTCGATYLMCCIGALLFFIVGKAMKMQPRYSHAHECDYWLCRAGGQKSGQKGAAAKLFGKNRHLRTENAVHTG